MSQRQATFGDLELQYHELKTAVDGVMASIIREYKKKLSELTSQNQQLMADLGKEKVKNSKEPEPKVIKGTKK